MKYLAERYQSALADGGGPRTSFFFFFFKSPINYTGQLDAVILNRAPYSEAP